MKHYLMLTTPGRRAYILKMPREMETNATASNGDFCVCEVDPDADESLIKFIQERFP